MIRLPAICFVAEGERDQLTAVLLLQFLFVSVPHQRRWDTVTGCVLRDQRLIVTSEVAFQRCDLTGQAAEIDPATVSQRRLDLRIAVARDAALDILGAAKRRKLLHALSGSMYHMELSVKGRAKHEAAFADDLRCQYGKNRAGRGSRQEHSVLGVAGHNVRVYRGLRQNGNRTFSGAEAAVGTRCVSNDGAQKAMRIRLHFDSR